MNQNWNLIFVLPLIDLHWNFTCIDISLHFKLIALVKQLPNTNFTPEINSRAFFSLISLVGPREQSTLRHFKKISQKVVICAVNHIDQWKVSLLRPSCWNAAPFTATAALISFFWHPFLFALHLLYSLSWWHAALECNASYPLGSGFRMSLQRQWELGRQ